MTASCPMCGGKWDIEGETYSIDLRCGDEHDIKCLYCENVIEFVMTRKDLEKANIRVCIRYEKTINELEKVIIGLNEDIKKLLEDV